MLFFSEGIYSTKLQNFPLCFFSTDLSFMCCGWGNSKIEAITRRILWISSADPEAKLLVFSSWNDVLDVLEHAFTANDISYVRMKGGRLVSVHLTFLSCFFSYFLCKLMTSGTGMDAYWCK